MSMFFILSLKNFLKGDCRRFAITIYWFDFMKKLTGAIKRLDEILLSEIVLKITNAMGGA